MHERQAIREAVIAQIKAAGTAAGMRVTKSRMTPVRKAELPAISVYTDDEEIDSDSLDTAPRELTRTVQVAVDSWVKVPAGGQVDDAFDDIALQVETAMDGDIYLATTAYTSILASTEFGIKDDGDQPMGCVHMLYTVVYKTDLRVQPVEDSFDTADVKFVNLGKGVIDADNQAEDLIDLSEDEEEP